MKLTQDELFSLFKKEQFLRVYTMNESFAKYEYPFYEITEIFCFDLYHYFEIVK